VKFIRNTMNVTVHVALHWTSERPPIRANPPAWMRVPQKMPYCGTGAFKQIKADIFIRKEFARTTPYDQFAICVAHEFSHVVLESINHPLRKEEKTVHLTAMLLGFSISITRPPIRLSGSTN